MLATSGKSEREPLLQTTDLNSTYQATKPVGGVESDGVEMTERAPPSLGAGKKASSGSENSPTSGLTPKNAKRLQVPNSFVRETTKFWVLPSNCLDVKRTIQQHIPEWRFDGKRSPSIAESGSWISSIYYDQKNWELYKRRLLRSDDSMLFRWRWYSKDPPSPGKPGFMEQKIRKPGWRGETSIKQRFDLPPEICMDFIKNGSTALPPEYQNINLPAEMTRDMDTWGPEFYPKLRTTYRRTVFQEFNGAAVRVSFDEDVHLSAVPDFQAGINMNVHEAKNQSFCFPLGILEVKLAFDPNDRNPREGLPLPDWTERLLRQGLITRVHKFSKYLTGISMLHVDEIERVPSWLEAVRTMIAIEMFKHGTEILGQTDQYIIEVPRVRVVEPRTFMANERTFLKWCRICFLAFFVALGLFGTGIDPITGIVLALCSLLILVRSYMVYLDRLKMIQSDKYRETFHDKYGPHLLMILFIVPVMVFIVRNGIKLSHPTV